MSRPALEAVCAQAKLRKRVYHAILGALLGAQEPGGHPDDVAGSLLRWKDEAVRSAVRRRDAFWKDANEKCAKHGWPPRVIDDIVASNHINEVEGQLEFEGLMDVSDEARAIGH